MSIRITPYKISRIDSYEIKRGLNRHDEAMIQGEMSAEEYLVYEEMADSSTVLSLFYKDEKNKETLLFAGVLKTLNVCEDASLRNYTGYGLCIISDGLSERGKEK